MSRILPLLWSAFGATLVVAFRDPQFWAFASFCLGAAAIWGEVSR